MILSLLEIPHHCLWQHIKYAFFTRDEIIIKKKFNQGAKQQLVNNGLRRKNISKVNEIIYQQHQTDIQILQDTFEDTKEVHRNSKSKNRQYNGQNRKTNTKMI